MNVTAPIVQAQPASGATPPNAAAAAAAPAAGAKSQDFARALNDANEKPARKSALSKTDSASQAGQQLPPAGKEVPSPLPPQAPVMPQDLLPVALPATGTAPLPGTTPKQDGAAADLAALADSLPAGDDGDAANTVSATESAAATPAAPAALAAPDEFSGLLNLHGAPRGTVPRTAGTDAKAVPSSDVDDEATDGRGAAPTASKTDTAQTLMAAAQAQARGEAAIAASVAGSSAAGSPAAGSPVAGSQALDAQDAAAQSASIQAASVRAADASSPAAQLAQQGAPLMASATVVAAQELAARPAVAEAAAALAASTAKAISSHAQSPTDGAAGVSQLASSTTATSDITPSPALKVPAEVGSAGFGGDLAAQVSLMVDSNLGSAKLQVNPPALGPIEVRIALQDGHAQVWLTSHSAVTRDALESSSANLRDMLSSQGFGQVSVDISHRSFQQDRSPQSQSYDSQPAFERNQSGISSASSGSSNRAAVGILDAYA